MDFSEESVRKAGLTPLKLEAKEGLALLNGTQTSTAFALKGLFEAEKLLLSGIVCGALSVEATLGSRKPFDARVQEVRGQKGKLMLRRCSVMFYHRPVSWRSPMRTA